jgi:hypothetical protein
VRDVAAMRNPTLKRGGRAVGLAEGEILMKKIAMIVAVLLVPAFALAGPTDEQKCQAKKNKVAGKYAFCLQKAVAKAVKKGTSVDTSKCIEVFDKLWNKAEMKWTSCPTVGDGAEIKGKVEQCMLTVSSSLACDVSLGGACWYLGLSGESCDDVCANLGLVHDPATSTFGAASDTNCNAIMDALGDASTPYVGPPQGCLIALGCYASGGARSLCGSAPDEGLAGAQRACACE